MNSYIFRLAQELEMTSDDGELDFEFKLREKELDLELGTLMLALFSNIISSAETVNLCD